MNTYYGTVETSPDEKMIAAERDDMIQQIEHMRKEIDGLNGELSKVKSDNTMLKKTIVVMAMKLFDITA